MPRILSGRLIFFFLLLLVFDLTSGNFFGIASARPILGYMAVVYAAFEWRTRKTLASAALVGVLRDMVGVQPLGLETSILVLASGLLDFVVQKIDRHHLGIRLATAFLFVFLVLVANGEMAEFLGLGGKMTGHLFGICAVSAIYSAILMPFFTLVTGRYFGERSSLKQLELFG